MSEEPRSKDQAENANQVDGVVIRLREKYPHWTIRSAPDPDCKCDNGELTLWDGRKQPCLCVCLSEVKDWSRAEFCKEVGNAARRIRKREAGQT